jgi:hypothetical protein
LIIYSLALMIFLAFLYFVTRERTNPNAGDAALLSSPDLTKKSPSLSISNQQGARFQLLARWFNA